MAKPIKETPVLRGKDAVRFVEIMKINSTKKVSANEMAKMMDSFKRIKAISHF